MYACTNCNGHQLQFSLCNGLCKYRHLITFYQAIKGFNNASQAEQMWIWQTQFGRPETSTHMLILQQHKACKKQLCRYGSPNNCQEVPIVKGSKQLTSDCLKWKEQHLNRCNHGTPPEIFFTVNKSCVYNPAQNPRKIAGTLQKLPLMLTLSDGVPDQSSQAYNTGRGGHTTLELSVPMVCNVCYA
jgi:hypothetical protein